MKATITLSLLFFLVVTTTWAQQNYTYEDLHLCELSTVELNQLAPNDVLEPCIIFQVQPDEGSNATVIPLVQVTPSNCGNHRDGAVTGVRKLNEEGWKIGFYEDHLVKFALISVIAGNSASLTAEEYDRRHQQLLRSLLESTGAPYIIGSCSFAAASDKDPALEYQAIVLSQVGPPGFYLPENSNPYVFGFHINSDEYTVPNVQELGFLSDKDIPIRVIYRTQSEFFFSTCQAAIDRLNDAGFKNIQVFLYDNAVDHDNDGDTNEFDVDFLQGLADQACLSDDPLNFNPAIFMCTLTEQDTLLARWLETGCRPQSIWLTASTWPWTEDNLDKVPYFQGGGQWHEKFDYSDMFFASGQQLLQYNQAIYGYMGGYDQLVSYAIPILFAQHLQSAYRVTDVPTPLADFADPQGREALRRGMMILNVETIFGPVAFNEYQRNIGRGAAGTQWLPASEGAFTNQLVAPILQAEASTVIPAQSAVPCPAGDFFNETAQSNSGSLLNNACQPCPVDTYTLDPTKASECTPCPGDSTTNGITGSDKCFVYNDNLLSVGILSFGYVAVSITWLLALGFLVWMLWHRYDPVVKVSQIEFLALICFGAMVSSAAVIALSFQAGLDEDTSKATAGCIAAPFLYTIGWVLQYSSLSAKTYRLFQTMMNTRRMRRAAVTALQMLPIVIICLLIDVTIVIVWTIKSPLVYERTEESREINEETGLVTISTVGRCVSSDDNFWAYAGPILGFHVFLVILTNALLCRVRDVADRYQEQKYVAMASASMVEILLVGIPVLVSVKDSASATFIVLTAVVALDDIAVLCFIFGPKINFQRKGLEKGVQFGESIMRESHKKASMREFSRREMNSFASRDSRAEPNGSGASPPHESSAEGEQDNDDNGLKRRDSFTNRITAGDRNRPFWNGSKESSVVASIAEETSEELKQEMHDSGTQMAWDGDGQNDPSSRSPTSNKMMMTQAGLVVPSMYADRLEHSTDERKSSSNESEPLTQQASFTKLQSPRSIEKQMKVMEMTKKLMEEHERMIQATAAMMLEHKRLKEELENSSSEFSLSKPSSVTGVHTGISTNASVASPPEESPDPSQRKSDGTRATEVCSDMSAENPFLGEEIIFEKGNETEN